MILFYQLNIKQLQFQWILFSLNLLGILICNLFIIDVKQLNKGSIVNNNFNWTIGGMYFQEKITFENQSVFVIFYHTYF